MYEPQRWRQIQLNLNQLVTTDHRFSRYFELGKKGTCSDIYTVTNANRKRRYKCSIAAAKHQRRLE